MIHAKSLSAESQPDQSVTAELDDGAYPIGIKITDRQMKDLPISRADWHGEWNYTLHPIR